MPHPCPKSCSRLATAAVFVSISVIQFIAGLILLKSEYVYLLSGPDFWTAASNLAVGILLGVSTSVWKDVQKTSFKHIVRRNILASLVASAITINSTTAVILIMGEANALLSIELERDGKYSSKSEILAYSYATSVCSPIVSVVVAIVFLSGMWFRVSDKGMKTPEIKSILKNDSIEDFNWVYKAKQISPKQNSKKLRKELSFKTLSSSEEEESFSLTNADLWSNTVHSIEYLKKPSQKRSNRTENLLHSNIGQQGSTCECAEKMKNISKGMSYETSRTSFADDKKSINFMKRFPRVSGRHFENCDLFSSEQIEAGDTNISSPSYEEFKKMHSRKISKQYKKRILLMEHPTFRQVKLVEGNNQFSSPEIYIPRAHARIASESKLSTTSDAEVEVFVDSKTQDWFAGENSSTSLVYLENVPSCDNFNETIYHKNKKFRRTSTSKHLNKSNVSQSHYNDSISRKICRTSTIAGPNSSRISCLDISNIQTDSVIDQDDSYESEDEKDTSAAICTQPASQVDSKKKVEDSFIDTPQSNALVGEVVKVQVNSLPRSPFYTKLVPVPIPIVSSVKKNPLKQKQKDHFAMATDKFSDRNELRFTSFRGDTKAVNHGSHPDTADRDKVMDQIYETVKDTTVCEMSPEDILPSPAKTSGYDSAIFENTHLSDSECFKSNLCGSMTNSPYYTPKKKFQNLPSPRNLDTKQ